jgi:dephospho-CoA kinase
MLRVGLTGGLGSGKSTVAAFLRSLGAEIVEADALGRELMEPGQSVFDQIVREFGKEVLSLDGHLNRAKRAQLAFQGGRIQQLNAIVHPAVIDAQRQWMEEVFARNPSAIAVVESALIFEVVRDAQARGEQEGVLADCPTRSKSLATLPASLNVPPSTNWTASP